MGVVEGDAGGGGAGILGTCSGKSIVRSGSWIFNYVTTKSVHVIQGFGEKRTNCVYFHLRQVVQLK